MSHDPGESELTRLQVLAHDLQNCLHVISEGLEVLKLSRHNEAKFLETCAVLEKERRQAAQLVVEMVKLDGNSSDP